ncbi:hypothetical protein ABUW04_10220 [Streptacidiphilus sp. N1-10]|uniref:Uncharacterized protein n=1 Tax=Streptacidiphilus jeojiensis TaxID=3229225 RepID=A0ABV6XKB3_9ACTN
MLTQTANRDIDPSYAFKRLSLWLRVREYAVPPSMIETATARRRAGDWAGACAAAGIDVDLDLRSVARSHGRECAALVRDDLRHLAPDLLRWHMPRIAPDGLLRPGLTVALARYEAAGSEGSGPLQLVARTAPAWADAGQRISLALWDPSRSEDLVRRRSYPHPRPDRRFRLDLHRPLWDARRVGELRIRSGADRLGDRGPEPDPGLSGLLPQGHACAVDRWAAEAAILLRSEGRSQGTVAVRIDRRHRLLLELAESRPESSGPPALRIAIPSGSGAGTPPILPDAATWVLPDLQLLRTGSIGADRLHPLVASALAPEQARTAAGRAADRPGEQPRLVRCRGAEHRIGLVDGVLAPLDHDPAEIRREELLVALTGTPLPCLQAIDEAHRRPDCLTGVRERLDHGDTAGALAVVEGLLGPDALLRSGDLRDELEAAAQQRITYGLFRAGLIGPRPQAGSGSGRIRPKRRCSHDPRPRVRHTAFF